MKLIVIVGPSCSGKSTLENKLKSELGLKPVVIHTSRVKRKDDPIQYIFRDRADIYTDFKIGKKIQHIIMPNTFEIYGYSVNKDCDTIQYVSFITEDLAMKFIESIKKKLDIDANVYHLGVSNEEVMHCMYERGIPEKEIEIRLKAYIPNPNAIHRDEIFNVIKRDIISEY